MAHTNFIKIVIILVNGIIVKKMDTEKFIFLIIALIVVNLTMEKLKEKVDYIIQIQIFILETGEKIKLMDMVNILQEMEPLMKDNGKMI